jgi:4'-phosphopantetheinyl transferase
MNAAGDQRHDAACAVELAFEDYTPASLPRGEVRDVDDACVDIWAYSLATGAALESWLALIAAGERERAMRFVDASGRSRFAVAHAVMRAILAQYVGCAPLEIDIAKEAKGKPVLGDRHGASAFSFNLAHSADRALLGVSRNRRIGVDLERENEGVGETEIARRFFSASEQAAIAAQRPDQRRAGFYRHWVAKEAVVKAHGGGMTVPLQRFDVVFADAHSAHVRSLDPDMPGAAWIVRMLNVGGGWYGAAAAIGHDWHVRFRTPVARARPAQHH